MGIYMPSEFHGEELAYLLACMVFAKVFEDLVGLFAFVDILAHGVVVVFGRSRECRFGRFDDLKAYTSGFYFSDVVLVLYMVTDVNGSCLNFARGEGIKDLLF